VNFVAILKYNHILNSKGMELKSTTKSKQFPAMPNIQDLLDIEFPLKQSGIATQSTIPLLKSNWNDHPISQTDEF
jgi:hypothetical protein